MYKKRITDAEINKLPPLKFNGNLHLIDKDELITEAVEYLNSQKMIGFDTETRPSFKRNVRYSTALIQLSSETDAFLFRLHYLNDLSPIFTILENPNIMKIGVAVNGDLKELNRIKNFNPANFLELQKYIKNFDIENISLKKMAAIVLGGKVSKRQQKSNWEAKKLSEAQLSYAATDAWVSLLIYKELQKKL